MILSFRNLAANIQSLCGLTSRGLSSRGLSSHGLSSRGLSSGGQATVEYIFILAFVLLIGFRITNTFTDFFRNTMGTVGHVLSGHVIVGVCPSECFYQGYANGYEGLNE